jgi:hypothetical protein
MAQQARTQARGTMKHSIIAQQMGVEKYTEYVIKQEFSHNKHLVIKFPNGYGASILKFNYAPYNGFVELAVLKFKTKKTYEFVYDTPITDDVLWTTNANEALEQIKNLEAK